MFNAFWKSLSPIEKVRFIFYSVVGTASIAGSIVCCREAKKGHDIQAQAMKNIEKGLDIEISEDVVNKAVAKAVESQAKAAARDVADTIYHDIRDDVREKVENSVHDYYKQINDEVANRMKKECEKIYKDQLLIDIKNKAAEKLEESLDSKLDDIAEKYCDNLDNMSKIYSALAEKMNSKA